MKIITLLLVSFLSLYALKLTKSGPYVIDDTHKLMWQDNKDNIYLRMIQDKAANYCKKLNLANFSDWRLPTVKENKYVVDKTRRGKTKINKAFRYRMPDDYWLNDRTWVRNFGLYGYYINLTDGNAYYQNRTYKMFIRCVRDMK